MLGTGLEWECSVRGNARECLSNDAVPNQLATGCHKLAGAPGLSELYSVLLQTWEGTVVA